MKIGRINFATASVVLLAIQLILVCSIAGKYLYQRLTCPRVWTRAAAFDPSLPDARPLPEPAAYGRRLQQHASLREAG